MNRIYVFVLTIILFGSCEKQEGVGGTSSIVGKINKIRYFKDQDIIYDTVPAVAEDVYIMYGENTYFDDRIETHNDGTFRFDYLFEGKYSVYVYSEDVKNQVDTAILITIKIANKDEEIKLDDIYIADEINGTSSISGTVMARDYYDANMNIKNPPYIPFPAIEEDVYIMYENNKIYFDRFRTDLYGHYIFNELIPGKYYIYVYTKIPPEVDLAEKLAVMDSTVITDQNQHILMPVILIEK